MTFGASCALLWGRCTTQSVVYVSLAFAVLGGLACALAVRSMYVGRLDAMHGTITASDAGVAVDAQLRCPWSARPSVALAPDRVYLVTRPSRSLLATRASFESERAWQSFVDTVARHAPKAARLDALPARSEPAPPVVTPVPVRDLNVSRVDGITVEFALEARDALNYAPLGLGREPGRAVATAMYMVLGFFVFGVVMSWTLAIWLLPVLFAVGWWVVPAVRATSANQRLMRSSRARADRMLGRRQVRSGGLPFPYAVRVTIDPEHFTWETERGVQIRTWSSLPFVGIKRDALVIRLAPQQLAVVPKRAFATEAAWLEFTDLAISYQRSAGSRARPS
jgi:hypothetical protein